MDVSRGGVLAWERHVNIVRVYDLGGDGSYEDVDEHPQQGLVA